MSNIFPKQYKSKLSIRETQEAIVLIKDYFEKRLSETLGLTRVSAPVFIDPLTGLNDNLSGKEPAVSFKTKEGQTLEIVQSLAKWKRYALKEYQMSGIYTDMNAIRKNEELDNIHSIYVDQWDWEKTINKEERNVAVLKKIVRQIYSCLKDTEKLVNSKYKCLSTKLVDEITFITSEELLHKYPRLSPQEREFNFVKEKKAVFIIGVGGKLSNGFAHGERAADYDDWSLNGDLFVWNDVLSIPFELSSMGIRVDEKSLEIQMKEKHESTLTFYHNAIFSKDFPLTIGGGIGQSRLSMFLLEKAHIGEVQSSYWPNSQKEEFKKYNIFFL